MKIEITQEEAARVLRGYYNLPENTEIVFVEDKKVSPREIVSDIVNKNKCDNDFLGKIRAIKELTNKFNNFSPETKEEFRKEFSPLTNEVGSLSLVAAKYFVEKYLTPGK